jgi:hypothetical protein
MATDTVDAVIAQLKLATVFSSRVYRGWPPSTSLMPDCGVSGTIDGERGIDHSLASWNIQVDSWAKSTTDIVAIEAAIRVVANKYHSVVHHREIPEAADTHIVSTLTVLGSW